MKRVLLGVVLAFVTGCHAHARVEVKAAPPPAPPPAQPAPEPPPAAGEQVVLPDQVEFEFNDARIKQTPATLGTLGKVAELMKKHPNVTKLRIEGHTDNRGSKKLNDRLSKARADAVASWLAQHEVDEKRLVTIGYGSRHPLKTNDTDANRAQNRRTEYYIEELDGKKVTGDGKSFESEPAQTAANGAGAATAGGKSTPN